MPVYTEYTEQEATSGFSISKCCERHGACGAGKKCVFFDMTFRSGTYLGMHAGVKALVERAMRKQHSSELSAGENKRDHMNVI
jgi:hypothetical protein